MLFDGSGNIALAPSGGSASLSPTADRLTYTNANDIILINTDGTGELNLTANSPDIDVAPVWTNAGDRIFYASIIDGMRDIFVMEPDGSGQTNITASPGANELAHAIAPDDRLIAYSNGTQILISNTDGTGRRILTEAASANSLEWQPCQ